MFGCSQYSVARPGMEIKWNWNGSEMGCMVGSPRCSQYVLMLSFCGCPQHSWQCKGSNSTASPKLVVLGSRHIQEFQFFNPQHGSPQGPEVENRWNWQFRKVTTIELDLVGSLKAKNQHRITYIWLTLSLSLHCNASKVKIFQETSLNPKF